MEQPATTPAGRFETADGREWYRIDGYDLLDPFLVHLVTPSDIWVFVSSSGALTAGRRSPGEALFPYETDDRLHRSAGRVGPLTIVRVGGEVWQPFDPQAPLGVVRRSVAKTVEGDRLRFEEHHPGLGLTFRATWSTADRFGLVRTCELAAGGDRPVDAVVLDGFLDVLPAGVEPGAQAVSSTLVDAYRRSEMDAAAGPALFTLESLLSDRPEPAESLRATVAWTAGLDDPVIALSGAGVRRFRSGGDLEPEHLVTGRKGCFLVSAAVTVTGGDPAAWVIAADTGCDHGAVARLRQQLIEGRELRAEVAAAVDATGDQVIRIVAGADALQATADRAATAHHFANVLFNSMRGGVFPDGYDVSASDVERFIAGRNRDAAARFAAAVAGSDLGDRALIGDVAAVVRGDADLERLVAEYLPLAFSRRHGDPSRPWNTFTISPGAGYEGNWRDIFQNWEALLHSYPGYLLPVIAKFLNASTVDGFNPYRISDRGIDWEVPEEGAWAYFGYWGDHQVAYLHRLLAACDRFHPGVLEAALARAVHSSADVPYRIVPYDELVADPKHTIVFDTERQAAVEERVARLGEDGRLVPEEGGGVHHASLAEKLLVPALSKLSSFVAGGGIWMNTQRPEWNDANNALVGNGVSMVTLFYLRDYLAFLEGLLGRAGDGEVPVGARVLSWLTAVEEAFASHRDLLDDGEIDPGRRRSLLDALGGAFSEYRAAAYDHGPGEPMQVPVGRLRAFAAAVRPFLDRTAAVRRPDGLAESYLLLRLEPGIARLEPLHEMLEGQVAALATGAVRDDEAVRLIDALFAGDLYRPDQHSFVLYPNRPPPPFMEKNVVPDGAIGPAARRLLDEGTGILERDAGGIVRFAARYSSAEPLRADLEAIGLEEEERNEVLALYEQVFRHAAFTGRSGTMYRYEGLGSVYWHMVSKLLLAVQEQALDAADAGSAAAADLVDRYRRIRAGLGPSKPVVEQGTFPTDPHSHTPAHTGAQQPGMTGQVKEGVLLRWGELGVRVSGGMVEFRPVLLDPAEFLTGPMPWVPLGPDGVLEAGTLGFTYCGVPVVYHLVDGEPWVAVDGRKVSGAPRLGPDESRSLFARDGHIARIDVGVPGSALR